MNLTYASTSAASTDVDATKFSGVKNLTVTMGDVTVGGSTIKGNKDADIAGVDATKVAQVTAGNAATTFDVIQATKAGLVVNADAVTGNTTTGTGDVDVKITGSATVSANGLGAGDTLEITALNNATEDKKAVSVTTSAENVLVRDSQFSGLDAEVVSTGGGSETLTIGVSQSTNDFSDLDIDSTVDSIVIDASARTAAVTITGTNGADTITTSSQQRALADTVTAGSGDDIVNIGQGGDTATGGSGTDTLNVSGMYGSDGADVEDGSSDASGIVVNMTASAISGATIASNMAGTQYISKSITEIAAGKAGYLFASDATSNSSVLATFSGFENITGSAGADYIVGNTSANTITGGGGDDYVDLGTDSAADEFVFSAFASNGNDTIKGFDTTEDHLNLNNVMTGVTDVVAVTGIAAAGGEADFIDNEVYVFADGATAVATGSDVITVYTNLTQVAAFLSENLTVSTVGTSNDTVTGDEAIFVINDLVADLTYVYHFKAANAGDASAADTIAASELTLIGIVTEESGAALVAADIV